MTKHNGKARKAGIKVGQALVANHKKGGGDRGFGGAGRHTTDVKPGGTNMQSVLERNDLEELMAMAELSGRDFTAEKSHVIVVSTGAVDPLDEQRAAEERAATEDRHRHRLRIPRRPAWDETTTPEQLDTQERTSFVEWRRDLASLEEEEGLCLTPFEKNLEVWRQLWRVLERSDIVVQVLDARDPLLYRCEDLEAYALELHTTKASLLLLNKADLLPQAARARWADYMEKVGMPYAFWSAVRVMDDHSATKQEAHDLGVDWHELRESRQHERRLARVAAEAQLLAGPGGQAAVDAARRTHILDDDELLQLLEQTAAAAVKAAGPDDPRSQDKERRLMVGLIGYPNVGKSSTINALFGAKKTAVAPTPGKTKHFQTLIVSPSLCLCDCPGLVMPKFARSKAEMVSAGVIPIDRLTEIRGPVEVLAQRVGRAQLEALYGLRLPPPPAHQPHNTPPTAAQLLRAVAALRGWTIGSGLPDENRAGRQLLKDYCAGKLLHCTLPPGSPQLYFVPLIHDPNTLEPLPHQRPHSTKSAGMTLANVIAPAGAPESQGSDRSPATTEVGALQQQQQGSDQGETAVADQENTNQGLDRALNRLDLDAADLDLLAAELGGPVPAGSAAKPKRAEHKFQKKPARSKGDRGHVRGESSYDGAAMAVGKKGGLVRVTGY